MTIILIGAGASGVTLLSHLARIAKESNNRNITIKLISQSVYFGRGKAFGMSSIHNIINTTSDTMSLDTINPQGYKIWLKNQSAFSDYTTRRLYSDYIFDTYNHIKKKSILKIEEYRCEALDISVRNDITIRTSINVDVTKLHPRE